ncbi:G-type lectin S-receptor-like serine/threonine-protein kinase At4g27290 isoform X2 [Cornus florida]|uniref:G-type lectin S-receptor-like serine/threonine-protein kinase At4g27290 isoform X2 n=1 Tax=Cornus florida TaxID=4283 RepID=UPI002898AB93|nr:G-type lectin S-receptor-like serine/threonine-protein kinase At4g27290 isoform X2 [Cornus florida]
MGINFAKLCYIFAFIFLYLTDISLADDQLSPYQPINGNVALISAGKKFRLGFFNPKNSRNQYLGIWYDSIPTQTVVWVANRDNPLNDSSGILKMGDDGNLILQDRTERIVWSTNIKDSSSKSTVAQLLDSGNLVLRHESRDGYIWQSFDHPSDTLLAGMKLGRDSKNGLDRYLTPWKSADDPAPGEFSYGIDPRGLPQLVIRKGSIKKFRSGPWDGEQFSGILLLPNLLFEPKVITDSDEIYYEYGLNSESTLTRVAQDWEMLIWSGGCVRKHPLNCTKGEGFIEKKGVKLPDFLQFWINTSMSLKDCEMECLKNCSCTAYANSDVTGGGSGCLLWYGDLIDIKSFTESSNQKLYIRVTTSDLLSNSKKMKPLVLVFTVISVALAMFAVASCIIWKAKVRKQGMLPDSQARDEEKMELPIFNMNTILEATNNFSDSNKIGEGGFGPVYKGQLKTGQEIAVKRLSENSKQGPHEFKNEVILIAKLQHRNLVRLLGCCIQGEEKILVYEYMPNGSLNSFIFGGSNDTSNSLVWKRRFDIIIGIARGLLYLHRDSRLTIIHRDLKASNVLLDNNMNPKISDFGIARAFAGDQLLAKTIRVVGTYGYMSPEYVIDGLFSMKSDVFSFGALVLEIVSGKRNRQFHHPDHHHNLLGHAWQLWIEGKAFELIDPEMEDSFPMSEVLRCVQIGLLCVQQHPEDRPTMSYVVSMFDSEGTMLAQPKPPGFFTDRSPCETESMLGQRTCTINKMTISTVDGR